MVINYQGDNYFKIQSGETTLLINPENQRSFKGAQVIVASERREGSAEGGGEAFFIDHQGEYSVKGLSVRGWSAEESSKELEKTVYRITLDDITIAVVTHLTKIPGPETQEHLKNADVLIIDIGCLKEFSAKLARQLEPGFIIPSNFKDPKSFFKEFNQTGATPEEKLVIKKKDVSPQAMKIVWLKA